MIDTLKKKKKNINEQIIQSEVPNWVKVDGIKIVSFYKIRYDITL